MHFEILTLEIDGGGVVDLHLRAQVYAPRVKIEIKTPCYKNDAEFIKWVAFIIGDLSPVSGDGNSNNDTAAADFTDGLKRLSSAIALGAISATQGAHFNVGDVPHTSITWKCTSRDLHPTVDVKELGV